MESDASGKDQVDVWSEGSDSKPVNVEANYRESEDEDEELYIFPQCAPAPTPAAAPKGGTQATAIVDSSGYFKRERFCLCSL